MCFRLLCLCRNMCSILDLMQGDESELNNYRNNLYSLYKTYKLHKIYLYSLRALQAIAGIGLTTMTTANNPYFKDNIDQINIIIWYISISNNIINILLEKSQSYNITDEKLKIRLLMGEAKKYLDNYKDYSLYNNDQVNKLRYFEKCCSEIIDRTPYEYLIYQGRRPSHATIDIKQKRLDINRAWEGSDDIQNIIIDDL